MSEFFKALGQAERDRAMREQARERKTASPEPPAPTPPTPPAPILTAVVPEEAPVAVAPPPPQAPAELMPFRRPKAARAPQPPAPEEEDTSDGIDGHLVSLVMPATFAAEQYRALRHMIEELRAASGVAVIAISSPSVGDGKTTTAINLAGALAQSVETRVLLIDADLRAPSVGRKFGLHVSPSPGLVGAILDRHLSLRDVVRRRPPFAVDFLPAGDQPTAPYELLKSSRLAELFQEARKAYDYIIVDTPPLVAVPDCRVLANVVDGFLVVVTAHRTPKRLLDEALNVVEPAKVIGLVYNGDERPLSGYYRREYGASENGNGHRKWRWGRR